MQSKGPGEPLKLSPVPEWWQAMATIVGLLTIGFFAFVGLPAVLNSDPLGSLRAYNEFPFAEYGAVVLLLSVCSVLLLYPLSFLTDRNYRQAPRVQQLRPWLIFLGIFCPFFPALTLTAISFFVWRQSGLAIAGVLVSAALLPLLNGLCLFRIGWKCSQFGSFTLAMNIVALVLSAVLTGLFLFVLRIELFALPMLCGLIGAVGVSWTIRKLAPPSTVRQHLIVAAALVGALWLFAVPIVSSKFHEGLVQSAVSDTSKDTHRAAVRLLRAFGNSDELVRGAYLPSCSYSMGFGGPAVDDYRKVHYWVTGYPFNEKSPPFDVQFMRLMNGDTDLAGTSVAGRATGLRLSSSQLDGKIDADGALASLSWQLSFVNDSDFPQEARAQILLPAGAVVSSAVLWVNGEPRNATITATDTARRAYQNVVLGQRDPLLVTTQGGDRIMIQCYPVPPKSAAGEMKIKIGISAPMELADKETARLALPVFVERNFDQIKTVARFVNAQTGSPADYPRTVNENSILCHRSSGAALRFTAEAPQGQIAEETLVSFRLPAPKNLFVVVDGSLNLARHKQKLIEALGSVPANLNTKLIFASDEVSSLSAKKVNGSATSLAEQLKDLQLAPFAGGPDNVPSLAEAIASASKTPLNAVVWLHGAQPLSATAPGWKAEDVTACRFYDMHIGGGSNALGEYLPGAIVVHSSEDTLAEDLKKCLNRVCGVRGQPQFSYRYVPADSEAATAGTMSPELNALCAKEQIDAYLLNDETSLARESAIGAKLVTPVTAAIVLEAAADYESNGIEKPEELKQSSSKEGSQSFYVDGAEDPANPGYESSAKDSGGTGTSAPVSPPPVSAVPAHAASTISAGSPMTAKSEKFARQAQDAFVHGNEPSSEDKASKSFGRSEETTVRREPVPDLPPQAKLVRPQPEVNSIAIDEQKSPFAVDSIFGRQSQLQKEEPSASGAAVPVDSSGAKTAGRLALNLLIGVMGAAAVFLIGLVGVIVHRRLYRTHFGLLAVILALGCGLILVKAISTVCAAAAFF